MGVKLGLVATWESIGLLPILVNQTQAGAHPEVWDGVMEIEGLGPKSQWLKKAGS